MADYRQCGEVENMVQGNELWPLQKSLAKKEKCYEKNTRNFDSFIYF